MFNHVHCFLVLTLRITPVGRSRPTPWRLAAPRRRNANLLATSDGHRTGIPSLFGGPKTAGQRQRRKFKCYISDISPLQHQYFSDLDLTQQKEPTSMSSLLLEFFSDSSLATKDQHIHHHPPKQLVQLGPKKQVAQLPNSTASRTRPKGLLRPIPRQLRGIVRHPRLEAAGVALREGVVGILGLVVVPGNGWGCTSQVAGCPCPLGSQGRSWNCAKNLSYCQLLKSHQSWLQYLSRLYIVDPEDIYLSCQFILSTLSSILFFNAERSSGWIQCGMLSRFRNPHRDGIPLD